ncbi:hypothetical protein D3C83_157010 [compost metagenome]
MGSVFARRMRSNSLRQLPPRSQAIILIQLIESTGDQGSGRTPVSQNSGGSTGSEARKALTPAA